MKRVSKRVNYDDDDVVDNGLTIILLYLCWSAKMGFMIWDKTGLMKRKDDHL